MVQAVSGVRSVWVTSTAGMDHAVADTEIASGRSGWLVAMCGVPVASAALSAPPGGRCARCVVFVRARATLRGLAVPASRPVGGGAVGEPVVWMVRYRKGVVGLTRRVVHVVTVAAAPADSPGVPGRLAAYCGEILDGELVELLDGPAGQPCFVCLLRTPRPAGTAGPGSAAALEPGV